MKRRLLLLVSLFVFVVLHAHQVTEQEALQKAQQFLQGKQFIHKAKKLAKRAQARPNQSFYIFNVENNDGFVIVSGDDRTDAILGYSEHGNLDMNSAPCNVKWLLQAYEQMINNLSENHLPFKSNRANEYKSDIYPLLDTQWGQGEPYNRLCPIVDGERCVTGCIATAMAQIVYNNRWPQGMTTSVPAYVTTTNNIEMLQLEPTQFDWNNMSQNTIAKLMLYCGQSVQMSYGLSESSASPFDVASALIDIWGYDSSATLVDRSNYTDDEWNALIYNELSVERAVLYSGFSLVGGHAFVVDGYQNGLFHVNWGWNGSADGYFSLNHLCPSGYDYNTWQRAVVHIQSPEGANTNYKAKAIASSITSSESSLYRSTITDDFPSFNISAKIISLKENLYVGIGLFNDEGMVKVISQEQRDFWYKEEYQMESQVILDNTLKDGSYRIIAICKENYSDKWIPANASTDYYLSVTIEGQTTSMQVYPRSSYDFEEFGNHIIDGVNYRLLRSDARYIARIVSLPNGEPYSGELYIPDVVSYHNHLFSVEANEGNGFSGSTITSLSIRCEGDCSYGTIRECPNLIKLEIREGSDGNYGIHECPQLKDITFPSTCWKVTIPTKCENLKTIHVLCQTPIELYGISGLLTNDDYLKNPQLSDIYFYGSYPPILHSENYDEYDFSHLTFHIPQGSLVLYKNSFWRSGNFVEDLPAVSFVNWDYCGFDTDNYWKNKGKLGADWRWQGNNDVEIAIKVPANKIKSYTGARITGIQYYTGQRSSNSPFDSDMNYVFITKPGTDYLMKQSATTHHETWTTIKLDTPYTITGEDLYVGVGRYKEISIPFANDNVIDSCVWRRTMGTDNSVSQTGVWESPSNNPVPIRLLIEGDNLPSDLLINRINYDDISGQAKVKVMSRAPFVVHSFSIGIYEDKELQDIQSFDTTILLNHEAEVSATLPAKKMDGRSHIITMKILSINEKKDEIDNDIVNRLSYCNQTTALFPRKVVMEEATGTWCSSSPRGIEIIKRMKDLYPDNFIPISIHTEFDPMDATKQYTSFFDNIMNIPYCHINRFSWHDLVLEDIQHQIDSLMNTGIAQIKADALFLDKDSTQVMVTTQLLKHNARSWRRVYGMVDTTGL